MRVCQGRLGLMRHALPNARIMVDQPMGGRQGQASGIAIQANVILRLRKEINRILAFHTRKSLKQISNDTDRDFFMSGLEAKEYGIVDSVMKNRESLT